MAWTEPGGPHTRTSSGVAPEKNLNGDGVDADVEVCDKDERAITDRPRVKRRVLVLCGDVAGNLGDHAILKAVCDTLRAADPAIALRLTVTCSNRATARRSFRATTLPTGWRAWPGLWRAARRSDLVICGGGGLFQDDDSLVKMPYWAARVMVAKSGCARVAGVSLGVGPLKAWVSRAAGRAALRRLDPVSVRDSRAQSLASTLTDRPVSVVPDPAMLLKPASEASASAVLAAHGVPLDGRPLIGVTARRWFPPRARVVPYRLAWRWRGVGERERANNRRLAGLLAVALDRVVERCGGHVVFLPSYNCPHEADDALCELVGEQLRRSSWSLIRLDSPTVYKAVTAKLSVMLGGRMHPTLLAASVGTPVVGLAYNPKFHGLFDLLGLEGRVIDVLDFVEHQLVAQLVETVERAMCDGAETKPDGEPGLAGRVDDLAEQTRTFLQSLVRTIR
ncbi:polysaccharide pyruvyl transferase family protein [Phycisphaerales bacterium AB-hyl4]|uniref:Polysaccharide pyruvyl transferase family protein n=1 Tax=Natronomicrosphaera hydrolytica TaxID=3242702 RepID=A0ABV4U361_9BACT